MKNCQSILLAEMPNSNIAKCLRSGSLRWYFNNLMVAFKEKDFMAFSRSFEKIDFDREGWGAAEGGRFVVISTPHRDIQFVFKEHEHKKLCGLFQKAITQLQILHIMEN